MMKKNRGLMKVCKYSLFALVLFAFLSCGQKTKTTRAGHLFAAPPDIAVDLEGFKPSAHPAFVYWSNTVSERGYRLDGFYKAVKDTLYWGYAATYSVLKPQTDGSIAWEKIDEKDFDPAKFGDIGANFSKNKGPLTMLYLEKKVKADDLTVVITDLEEQGLNATALASGVRDLLSSPDNAAALIALKLPFTGTNQKPNPQNPNGPEIAQRFNGEEKPLYMIVTGLKDAVAVFVNHYEQVAKSEGVPSDIVTTLHPSDGYKAVKTSDVIIPERAALANQTRVDKNKNVTKDLWNYRNNTDGVPLKIWNLQDQYSYRGDYVGVLSDSGELTKITNEELNIKLLQYKPIKGNAKNGHKLWQVNIAYKNLPAGYDVSNIKPKIDNYRYLSDGVWQPHDQALLDKDLVCSENVFQVPNSDQVAVYVVPKNARGVLSSSSTICFDVVLQAPVSVPSWVEKYDGGVTTEKDKTNHFKVFVSMLLNLKPSGEPEIVDGNELARTTVVLFDMPTQKKQKPNKGK